MNLLFAFIFILSSVFLLFLSPDSFLPSLLGGASKSATLCVSLIATYSVWLGLMNVWKDSGVTDCVSKLVRPLTKKLFKTEDEETVSAISMNLSVNLLGISGAATPYGIQAARLLDKSEHAEYASAMFFVLNATSIQLIPTSIIGIRVALKSGAPADIVLPTLLTTAFSTLVGALLVRVFIPPKKAAKQRAAKHENRRGFLQTRGAGLR